jgi:hypothetical protein
VRGGSGGTGFCGSRDWSGGDRGHLHRPHRQDSAGNRRRRREWGGAVIMATHRRLGLARFFFEMWRARLSRRGRSLPAHRPPPAENLSGEEALAGRCSAEASASPVPHDADAPDIRRSVEDRLSERIDGHGVTRRRSGSMSPAQAARATPGRNCVRRCRWRCGEEDRLPPRSSRPQGWRPWRPISARAGRSRVRASGASPNELEVDPRARLAAFPGTVRDTWWRCCWRHGDPIGLWVRPGHPIVLVNSVLAVQEARQSRRWRRCAPDHDPSSVVRDGGTARPGQQPGTGRPDRDRGGCDPRRRSSVDVASLKQEHRHRRACRSRTPLGSLARMCRWGPDQHGLQRHDRDLWPWATIVTATGMRTEMGRIAGLFWRGGRQATPLQRSSTAPGVSRRGCPRDHGGRRSRGAVERVRTEASFVEVLILGWPLPSLEGSAS